ncbi:MAG: M16 family metallopeptidase [Acidimicrobiia bacterium]
MSVATAAAGAGVAAAGRAADRPAPTLSPDPGVERTELPNGLQVVTEVMPEALSVSVGAWVGVGGRDEPAPVAGASHFLEHLLFKGTERRSARDIAESIDAVGGDINAFTSREHTAYHARLPHQHLGLAIEVIGDVLSAPALRPDDVEAERQVIVEEILMNLDSPEDRVHSLLSEALFPGHPLGRDVLGDRSTVEAIGRDDVAGFFAEWYRPSTMVVAAAGRLDHRDVVARVGDALGGITGGGRPVRVPPVEPPRPRAVVRDDTEQAHLCLGWRGLDQSDPARWALAVANQLLGGGTASRLFQHVREERGLAYSVYSYPTTYQDAGALTVYLGTAPRRVPEALTVVDAVLDDLVAGGPTGREVEVAKGFLSGSMLLGLEDSGGRMGRLGRDVVHHGEVVPIEVHLARLDEVDVKAVRAVLERVLAGPRTLAAVGPVEGL